MVGEEELVKSDSDIEEILLDEAEKIKRPEVMKAINTLKEGSQKHWKLTTILLKLYP